MSIPPPITGVTAQQLTQMAFGTATLPGVLQACPDCDLGSPAHFCPTCHGIGTVTNEELDRWLIRRQV